MPYIITTTKTAHGVDLVTGDRDVKVILARTAVATLDEVRETAVDIVGERTSPPTDGSQDRWDAALLALDATGGTVGPLPDGTVIEVRPVKWREIIAATDRPLTFAPYTPDERTTILAEYNGAHAC